MTVLTQTGENFTRFAMLTIISAFSTEHGPAMTVIAVPPIVTLSLTLTGRVDFAAGPVRPWAASRYGREPSLVVKPPPT